VPLPGIGYTRPHWDEKKRDQPVSNSARTPLQFNVPPIRASLMRLGRGPASCSGARRIFVGQKNSLYGSRHLVLSKLMPVNTAFFVIARSNETHLRRIHRGWGGDVNR